MRLLNKRITTLMLVTSLALSFTMTSYAKTGPEDYYDSYESSSHIEVGTDIAPGEYVLFNKNDAKNATISIRADGKTILNDSFWYNYIINVDDDDDIYLGNCYLVEFDEARVYSVEEGFYKVGEHIQPGKYVAKWIRGGDSATVAIYSDLYYSNDDEYTNGEWKKTANISKGGSASLTVEEGDYIKLSGCYLLFDEDDDE